MIKLLAVLIIMALFFPVHAKALDLGSPLGGTFPIPRCDYCGKNRQGKTKKDTNVKRFAAPSRGLSIPPKKGIEQQTPDTQKEKSDTKQ